MASIPDHDSASHTSHTAREFIDNQLQLEADAREALPYSFDSCTKPLGPLRQSLFACLTCSPPSSNDTSAAGVCYSCSIVCHGEHTLVELFSKRNFVCDCGSTRLPSSAPCTLRNDPHTGAKGVRSEEPAPGNKYNQNFQNRFCGCGEQYDTEKEKGTMFQCLGLGTVETGGCGEDWWHPECLVGLPRDWYKTEAKDDDEPPLPPGFPGEDDFETFVCYKCIDSNPWLKRYAGSSGFLPVHRGKDDDGNSKKRKLEGEEDTSSKRPKTDPASESEPETKQSEPTTHKHDSLPKNAPSGTFSLFLHEDFRDRLCRCPSCFPNLAQHPQLREEEDTYEPPLSDDGNNADAHHDGGGSTGTGSLLDRGEAAFSNMDRVRAIEGAMVYNHLRDKVKEFLTPFAESGKAVGAEDIKTYFETLRGDEQGIKDAAGQASASGGGGGGGGDSKDDEDGNRREQSESLDARRPAGSGYTSKVRVRDKYHIVGFISSGTYGRVYKAIAKDGRKGEFAIKKFKPEKEGEAIQYTGLSQSAIREMSLCSELDHPNVVQLEEIILEDKCIFMVFEYTDHDLLQIIHHHTHPHRHAIPAPMVRSILFQLLNGLYYLHTNWVLHRDLKPANILVTSSGAIRIGDLGLARLFYKPLNSLFSGDKVVVTIWYRAPELLMGSRHYTPAVDLWAVGCIFAELLSLRPIFKGEEAKMDSKKTVPFQRNQMMRIIEIMGMPRKETWPGLVTMPEYSQLQSLALTRASSSNHHHQFARPSSLDAWYQNCLKNGGYSSTSTIGTPGTDGFDLLSRLLEYDPTKRITAQEALEHPYFKTGGPVSADCFQGLESRYPHRRVTQDDSNIRTGSLPGTKRSGLPEDSLMGRAAKRLKE